VRGSVWKRSEKRLLGITRLNECAVQYVDVDDEGRDRVRRVGIEGRGGWIGYLTHPGKGARSERNRKEPNGRNPHKEKEIRNELKNMAFFSQDDSIIRSSFGLN